MKLMSIIYTIIFLFSHNTFASDMLKGEFWARDVVGSHSLRGDPECADILVVQSGPDSSYLLEFPMTNASYRLFDDFINLTKVNEEVLQATYHSCYGVLGVCTKTFVKAEKNSYGKLTAIKINHGTKIFPSKLIDCHLLYE